MNETLYFALAVDGLLILSGVAVAFISYRGHKRDNRRRDR